MFLVSNLNTMKMKFFPFVLGLIFLFSNGCKKDNTGQLDSPHQLKIDLPCSNPNNPFDSIGYHHNLMVSALLQDVTSANVNDSVLFFSSEYLYTWNFPMNFDSLICHTPGLYYWYQNIAGPITYPYFKSTIQNSFGLTTLAGMYLDSLNLKLNLYGDDITKGIIRLETTIINDGNLSTSDKNNLLVVTAVARYSNYFWANYSKKKDTMAPSIVLGDLMGAYYGLQYSWLGGWWTVIGGAAIGSTIAALGDK
jgi:hypothetical protein